MLDSLEMVSRADFDYIKTELVWEGKSTGANPRWQLADTVRHWIDKFKGRRDGKTESVASWGEFASKVNECYQNLIE